MCILKTQSELLTGITLGTVDLEVGDHRKKLTHDFPYGVWYIDLQTKGR